MLWKLRLHAVDDPLSSPLRRDRVQRGEVFAYLAGIVDGDGYLKVTRNYRTPGTVHPYYASVVGVQQLWPSEAVSLFATIFGGTMMKPQAAPRRRLMARCEIRGGKAEAATRRLLPFLLLKKGQAILVLEIARLRPHRHGRARPTETAYDDMERVRQAMLSLHDGSWPSVDARLPVASCLSGYHELSPDELGWSREQLFAYLAGIIDSDGSLRVEKRRVKGMLAPQYRISIRCAQVTPSPAVELLAKTFGGRLAFKKPSRPQHRELVSWSLHDKGAVPAIKALLPYFRVKHLEAYHLLELRGLKAHGKQGLTEWEHRTRWQRPIRMRKRCYTPDQVAEFERIHRAVQALHSRNLRAANPTGAIRFTRTSWIESE